VEYHESGAQEFAQTLHARVGAKLAYAEAVSRRGRVLVVDDEVHARTTLAELLRDEGYEVEMAADAFKALGKYETFAPQVVVTDFQMPGMDGLELVKRIRANEDPAAVIVMTAFGAVQSAVEAMRAGAADYLAKPLDFDELLIVLDRVFELQHLHREMKQLRARIAPGNLVGSTPAVQRIFETIEQVAASKATVLITGEAGSGKETIAHAIHRGSPRAHRPFVKLHCAGLALLDSELFGYERGAIPGAVTAKDGALVQADGGTLFLDEVAEISSDTQVKLLRFLQDHQLERVGGSQPIKVDVRVVAATQRDLAEAVAKGRFREDLYYRLKVVSIDVPPLRERTTDIPALAKLFISKYGKLNNKIIDGMAPDALESLAGYDWPGNVRELENAIESAVVLTKGSILEARSLPSTIAPGSHTRAMPRIPGSTMAELERYAIVETMKAVGGSTSKAAEMLGISTRTVQYRLHQYNEAPRSDFDVVKKGS
jgi:DNA-binding NtrC family response regulator